MSALPPKADIWEAVAKRLLVTQSGHLRVGSNVRFCSGDPRGATHPQTRFCSTPDNYKGRPLTIVSIDSQ